MSDYAAVYAHKRIDELDNNFESIKMELSKIKNDISEMKEIFSRNYEAYSEQLFNLESSESLHQDLRRNHEKLNTFVTFTIQRQLLKIEDKLKQLEESK